MDKKIAILIGDYFEESELTAPIKLFKKNRADVTIVSARKKKLQAMNGADKSKTFTSDLLLEDADSKDFDALVLPGGIYNATSLRINDKAQAWAVDFIDNGRPVAASGYSSLLLVSADLVEERRLTSPPEIKDDIKNAGGEWINRSVVVDKNLITCRSGKDSNQLSSSMLNQLI
ncbi:MAG TPA: DJ-1/PfpI family protein [Candidatus Saccharimonadales bacterium]|nr:DJ-1/PfpI family protein [Candidatus Saccharimonadales bacterium]